MELHRANPPTVSSFGQDWIEAVRQSVASLRYGTAEIIVHDGNVTQIERTERVRFEKLSAPTLSGSSPRNVDSNRLRVEG